MTSDALKVGIVVIQRKKPEWGPGKVVKLDGQRAYVVWRDLPDREAKLMVTTVLERAEDQSDSILIARRFQMQMQGLNLVIEKPYRHEEILRVW